MALFSINILAPHPLLLRSCLFGRIREGDWVSNPVLSLIFRLGTRWTGIMVSCCRIRSFDLALTRNLLAYTGYKQIRIVLQQISLSSRVLQQISLSSSPSPQLPLSTAPPLDSSPSPAKLQLPLSTAPLSSKAPQLPCPLHSSPSPAAFHSSPVLSTAPLSEGTQIGSPKEPRSAPPLHSSPPFLSSSSTKDSCGSSPSRPNPRCFA